MFSNQFQPQTPTSHSLTSFFLSPIPKARPATEYKPSDTPIPFPFRSLYRRRDNSQHPVPSLELPTRETRTRESQFANSNPKPRFLSLSHSFSCDLLLSFFAPALALSSPHLLFPSQQLSNPAPHLPSPPHQPFHTSLSNHTNLHDPRLKQESYFFLPFLSSPLPPLILPLTAFPFTSLRCRPRITRWVGRYQRCS